MTIDHPVCQRQTNFPASFTCLAHTDHIHKAGLRICVRAGKENLQLVQQRELMSQDLKVKASNFEMYACFNFQPTRWGLTIASALIADTGGIDARTLSWSRRQKKKAYHIVIKQNGGILPDAPLTASTVRISGISHRRCDQADEIFLLAIFTCNLDTCLQQSAVKKHILGEKHRSREASSLSTSEQINAWKASKFQIKINCTAESKIQCLIHLTLSYVRTTNMTHPAHFRYARNCIKIFPWIFRPVWI